MDEAAARLGVEALQSREQRQGPVRRSFLRFKRMSVPCVVEAIREYFAEVEEKKYKVHVRVFLSRYRGYAQCPDCHGSRLRKEALYVRVADKTIADW